MNTCKTCRFWDKERRICDKIEPSRVSGVLTTDAFMFVDADDDSGLYAYFKTGPDFGCTLHQPKPEEPTP